MNIVYYVKLRGIFVKKLVVIHPFLFAVFPILFLFAYNIDEVSVSDLFLPIVVVTIFTLALFFLLKLIIKSYYKSGIITSCFVILFFSYGHVSQALMPLIGYAERTFILGSLWALFLITVTFLVIKSRHSYGSITRYLNIVTVILIIISIINIGIYEIRASSHIYDANTQEINKEANGPDLNISANLPDIYYIILDSYAAQNTLKEVFDYDNSEFIADLTRKGFYVSPTSRSNYAHSYLSLSSSLNMEYITFRDSLNMASKIQNNIVARLLKSKGYRNIYVSEGTFSKELSEHAEVYLPEQGAFGIGMTNFVIGLIKTTALEPFRDIIGIDRRKDILFVFETLADIPDIEEPTFVVAHLNAVHTPFVFDRDGNPTMQAVFHATSVPQYYQEGYIEQLIFMNKKIGELIDEILSKSDTEPVIILQADHGPRDIPPREGPVDEFEEIRVKAGMSILNAYYLPENGSRFLYESITPVNTFRMVFNLYLDEDYELLKDESYYSYTGKQFDFIFLPPEGKVD